MKQHLTKLTAAGLAVLALTGCTGGAQETAPSPQSAETTWTLTVGQPEDSTCWAAAEAFASSLSVATDGVVAVEVQPAAIGQVESLEQTVAGVTDFYLDSSLIYGSYDSGGSTIRSESPVRLSSWSRNTAWTAKAFTPK